MKIKKKKKKISSPFSFWIQIGRSERMNQTKSKLTNKNRKEKERNSKKVVLKLKFLPLQNKRIYNSLFFYNISKKNL